MVPRLRETRPCGKRKPRNLGTILQPIPVCINNDKFVCRLNQVLNFDSPRGGISLETEKSRTGTTSKLLVTRAGTRDSGNYTCLPSRGEAVSADVHVITGQLIFN